MFRILVGVMGLLCCLGTVGQAADETMQGADLAKIKVLDLKTAQSLAVAGNPSVEAAKARVEQAKARVSQAIATWWPTLDVSGSGTRVRLSDSSYQGNQRLAALWGGATDQSVDRYGAGAQATWVLFDGFYRNFKQQQAAYDEQSAAAALVDTRRLLVSSVAEAFLNAQLAQTRVDIARADETFYNRQLEDAQNRFKVGAGPWGDVLNIKVQLNTAKTGLMLYQREFEAAGYGLAALMGVPEAAFPPHVRLEALDKETAATGQGKSPEELIGEAQAARPDIRRLEMLIKQAEATKGMAKAPFYPKVQVAGVVEGVREGDAGLSSEDFGSSVGMNMSWNLYAGGADKARMIEAEQAKREAVYSLANLRNSVAAEVRQALALLAAAQEQVRLQRETVKLVQENRDLAKNEYEAGEASLVRLNEAQRDLNTTYSRFAQALVSYHLAMQRLLSATGQNLAGLEPPAKDKR